MCGGWVPRWRVSSRLPAVFFHVCPSPATPLYYHHRRCHGRSPYVRRGLSALLPRMPPHSALRCHSTAGGGRAAVCCAEEWRGAPARCRHPCDCGVWQGHTGGVLWWLSATLACLIPFCPLCSFVLVRRTATSLYYHHRRCHGRSMYVRRGLFCVAATHAATPALPWPSTAGEGRAAACCAKEWRGARANRRQPCDCGVR